MSINPFIHVAISLSIHLCNHPLYFIVHFQGYLTGGKDGIIVLWDEVFQNVIKSYNLEQSAVAPGSQLFVDYPPIRALSLGRDCILVGTKNSEVRAWLEVWSPASLSNAINDFTVALLQIKYVYYYL